MRMATWLRIPQRLVPGGFQGQHVLELASMPMVLDPTFIEGEAERLLDEAALPSSCPSQRLVALAHGLPSMPVVDSTDPARLFNGVIYYDSALSRSLRNYVVAHELAHGQLAPRQHRHSDVIALGWALLCPRSVIIAEGWNVARIARRLHSVPRWVIYARITLIASASASNDVEPLVLSAV